MTVPQDTRSPNGVIIQFSQTMDNAAYIRDTESKEVRIALETRENPKTQPTIVSSLESDASSTTNTGKRACKPELCRKARSGPRQQPAASPWTRNKTYYLLGLVIMLVLWAIIYTTLSYLHLL